MKSHSKKDRTISTSQLRIVGGQWRSRKLAFAEVDGLRPTADRIRETLFNWLAPHIQGARVLDVFSGSGAMLFEAMSRGAASSLGLESSRSAQRCIEQNLKLLNCNNAQIICTDALNYLAAPASNNFDIVLLDPPFYQGLLEPACQLLEENGWLADNALIYLETELPREQFRLPENWQQLRAKHSGQLHYGLWQRKRRN